MTDQTARAMVSVIVPVCNSSRTIEACLQSLIDHVPADCRQIVVVDNGSKDDTPAIVRRFPVELHLSPDRWVSDSRNLGVRLSRHEQLAFVDSDCLVRSGWYETLSSALSDPNIGIVGCKYELRDSPSWVESAWNLAHGDRCPSPHDVEYVPGGNLAMRRAVFDACGRFSAAVETGEDMDLCQRVAAAGYRVVQNPHMVCVHLGEPQTLGAVFRRNRWHGRGARLRYPNGRRSPVIIGTMLFAILTLVSAAAILVSVTTGATLPAWVALPAVIPAIYAARYARAPRLKHFSQLWAIYAAYFLGRACALPTVVRETLSPRQRRLRHDAPVTGPLDTPDTPHHPTGMSAGPTSRM